MSRQSGTISIAGQANLSLTRSEGWANFVMGWSHSAPASASYFYAPATSTTANMTVTRTDGTVNLCTAGVQVQFQLVFIVAQLDLLVLSMRVVHINLTLVHTM